MGILSIFGKKDTNNKENLVKQVAPKKESSAGEPQEKEKESKKEDIKIVDGSGVSKNNLVTADFMTDFLVSQDTTQNILQTAGEGTLSDRMLYFGKDLKAKTGTLSDVSALTGYITSKSGKTYAFDIMINDAKSKMSEKKMLEEYILRVLYSSY